MKRTAFTLMLLSLVSLTIAGPVSGFYTSTELGGSILDGRWSEAWFGGNEGAVGSVVGAASWDGTALGTMWELSGETLSQVTLVSEEVLGNLTTKVYETDYAGGDLILKNTGPWWNSADSGTEYALTINTYSHNTTKYYYNGQLTSFTTNVYLDATFDEYPGYEVIFTIAVAVPTGAGSTPPAGYPAFNINTTAGAWGVAQKIRMQIIPEPATLVLLGLGGLFLSKRRK